MADDAKSFVVHQFTSRTAASSSQSSLITHGSRILRDFTAEAGWTTVPLPCCVPSKKKTPSYMFTPSLPPPTVQRTRRRSPPNLEGWGTPIAVENTDVFRLKDLEEFQGTDLTYLLTYNRKHNQCPNVDNRPLEGSLYHLVPQPHYFSYPRAIPQTPDRDPTLNLTPFLVNNATPIHPYTLQTARSYLSGRYARSAWVVPVRGTIPLSAASKASIFATLSDPELGEVGLKTIKWSIPSIRIFWKFFQKVREAQTLGPISLAFHAVTRPTEAGISACDHIKVFHDAVYAMYVRRVLDAWKYDEADEALDRTAASTTGTGRSVRVSSTSAQTKVRVLKDAKLVLVDESGESILVI